jgi:phosphatidylinositol glycan class C protein
MLFLCIFARLKEQSVDARMVVWSSGAFFMAGYVVWEILEYSHGRHAPERESLSK